MVLVPPQPSSPENIISVPGGVLSPLSFLNSAEYELPILRLAPKESVPNALSVKSVTRPSGTTTVSPHTSTSSSVALLLPGLGSVVE